MHFDKGPPLPAAKCHADLPAQSGRCLTHGLQCIGGILSKTGPTITSLGLQATEAAGAWALQKYAHRRAAVFSVFNFFLFPFLCCIPVV